MRYYQLTLNHKHILDGQGRPYAFDSKETAIDFAIANEVRYDVIYEVCIMPAEYIADLEVKANNKPS